MAGLYTLEQDVDLARIYTYAASDFYSAYTMQRNAVYADTTTTLNEQWSLDVGVRAELYSADYDDSNAVRFAPDDDLFGGKLALNYHTVRGNLLYGSISRGYKNGGFNTDGSLDADLRDSERLLNLALAEPLAAALERCTPQWSLAWPAGNGDRLLTGTVWSWRVAAGDPGVRAAAAEAVRGPSMTLARAGLRALHGHPLPERQQAVDAFYQRWQNKPVILDAWSRRVVGYAISRSIDDSVSPSASPPCAIPLARSTLTARPDAE